MSKLSELHAELDEQAGELGFCGVEDALEQGWQVDYESAKLRPPVVQPTLSEVKELEREQEKAREAWLKERDYHVKSLEQVAELLDVEAMPGSATTIRQAAKFLGECYD